MFAQRPRGTGRNLRDVYRMLTAQRDDWRFTFYSKPGGADRWWYGRTNTRRAAFDLRGERWDSWLHLGLPARAVWDGLDLLHCPANRVPLVSPIPYVATIHDLIPLECPNEATPPARDAFAAHVRRAVRNAVRIITPSEATRAALMRRFRASAERISVVPWAPDDALLGALRDNRPTPEEVCAVTERLGVGTGARYVLNFSGEGARKNARGLLRAAACLRPAERAGLRIVLVGCEPSAFRTALEAEARQLGVADVVLVRGFVDHSDLPALLRGAAAVALPSFCEGFGLPILDAFAAGAPVVTSRCSSMPEVAADAAEYCGPDDPQSIADALRRALEPQRAAGLRRLGFARLEHFSWSRTAELLGDALAQAAEEARRPGRILVAGGLSAGRGRNFTPRSRAARGSDAAAPVSRSADKRSQLHLRTDCRHYRGDRPCSAGVQGECPRGCTAFAARGTRVLVIKLGALGDVVRTAAILPALKQRYPQSEVTWVSRPSGCRILKNHPAIDRLLEFDAEAICHLEREQFDLVLSLDKEPGPTALAERVRAPRKLGMGMSPHGPAIPFDATCDPYFRLGLDDNEKFYNNTKSYPQLIFAALGWEYRGERYRLYPGAAEQARAAHLWQSWGVRDEALVLGLNTGAGAVFANKNWSLAQYEALIRRVQRATEWRVALLGGPAEAEQNAWLAQRCRGAIDTGGAHRELEFAALVARCNAVVTGDTLGLHVAVAADVPVVALFGPTCAAEIDLFGRGEKLVTALGCAPCYKRSCDVAPNCMESLSVDTVWQAVRRQIEPRPARPRPSRALPLVEVLP